MKLTVILLCALILTGLIQPATGWGAGRPVPGETSSTPAPGITRSRIFDVTTNLADYPNGQVPRYGKFEATFQVDTVAENLQLPYDATPPPGLKPAMGITVNALFTPNNWQTVYTQPAFYYQEFDHQTKSGRDWIYPTGRFAWKVRFAPNQTGVWQYKLFAQDASGTVETTPVAFTVASSDNKGFVRVSQRDSRYFEYDDGAYFPGLGYNMNYNHVAWDDPILGNQYNFSQMGRNGIQLARIWLSEWGIFTSGWNAWNSIDPSQHAQYIPYAGLSFAEAFPGSEVSMKIAATYNPCMFLGFGQAPPAVKRNTNYRVQVRYKTADVAGPRVAGSPYGFVIKTGGWLWGTGTNCADAGVGTVISARQSSNTASWAILEGQLNTGNRDFLPNLYLVTENMSAGRAYVDYVWIQEDLGNGQYGPNIVAQPWMAHHLYFDQRQSYAFDQVLELARQHGVYLKPVVLEKNEWLLNRFDYNGTPTAENCSNPPPSGTVCPDNKWFYGNWRGMTKTRWLQQAWWRYLQARWGYSPQIHSWELLNEGDPFSGLHYTLADEFGKYMHQFKPDDHLVTTSFWHSFPKSEFWANASYPNIDYADVHQYMQEGAGVDLRVDDQSIGQYVHVNDAADFYDTAAFRQKLSAIIGAKQPHGIGKPVMRGETGLINANWQPVSALDNDTSGVWLHNYVWGSINPGGLLEQYWFDIPHIYKNCRRQSDGSTTCDFDRRDAYGPYYNFIKTVPLNNGAYQDAQAVVTNPNLRVWGQKDLVNGRAHLWIANPQHTWKNVLDRTPIPPVSGSVKLDGFTAGRLYVVQWWDTYQTDASRQVTRTEWVTADAAGSLTLQVANLAADVAVKIGPELVGDVNLDCVVDNADVQLVVVHWGATDGQAGYSAHYDLDPNGRIDIQDLMLIISEWGHHCQ